MIWILSFLALLIGQPFTVCRNQQITRLIIVAVILLFSKSKYNVKLEVQHWLFIAWIAWASIGTLFAIEPEVAFFGFYPYRAEGLITWLIITVFAYTYWKSNESLKTLSITSSICILTIIAGYLFVMLTMGNTMYAKNFFGSLLIPDVGVSSYVSQAAIVTPFFGIIGIIPLLFTQNRSGIIAYLICFPIILYVYGMGYSYMAKYKKTIIACFAFIILCIGATLIIHPDSKVFKLPSFSLKGERVHWLKQSYNLSKSLPLFGYGLDNLENVLTFSSENSSNDYVIPDRTHNIAMDAILMTGWIGFTLLLLSLIFSIFAIYHNQSYTNMTCGIIILSHIIFALANPHCIAGDVVALIALFGIRRNT